MKKTIILFILFILSLSVAIFLVVQEEQRKSVQTTILQNQRIQEQGTSKINTEFFEGKKVIPTPQTTLKPSPAKSVLNTTPTSNTLFLTISSPQNKQTIKEANVLIKGKTLPRTQVMVNEFEIISDVNGNFSQSISMDEGENYISVVVYSSEGDAVEKELVIMGEVSQEW